MKLIFPTNRFQDKHILVGVTGGIAAYKAAELVRYLVTAGAEVRVVMTPNAEKFITPLTLETLSGHSVAIDMFPQKEFAGTHHIHLADWAEAVIILPATYNFIGKIAAGIADDLLTTIVAALQCPVVIAPAMNVHMWENPILERNLSYLKELGYLVCPPEEGYLAEGYSGKGRLAPLEHLVQYVYRACHPNPKSLQGKRILITAGPTVQYLDPVRALTNRSSGKMGYALAWEAFARGAEVTLIHGPGHLPIPTSMNVISVTSAAEMHEAVLENFKDTDIYVGAAAVADYTPKQLATQKLKKQDGEINLPLERTVDILLELSKLKSNNQTLIGFAVETEEPEKNARAKLKKKNLDMVVLNDLTQKNSGFEYDTNKVTIFHRDGEKKKLPLISKLDVAYEIFDFLLTF